MNTSPSNTSAIVTGGASGIGRALSIELAKRGTHVTVADRQHDLAEQVAGEIRGQGNHATAVDLDVRDPQQFQKVVDETLERSGRLDYLFNNAGIGVAGEIRDYELADWYDVFDVNLRGVIHGIHAAYPKMIEQGAGHIINTASMAGLAASSLSGSYAATKHAVVGLSKALRTEASGYGVRVSVLCPGPVRTPILGGGVFGRTLGSIKPEWTIQQFERLRPMDPTRLAQRTLADVDRNRAIIIHPTAWRILWYLERLSPGLTMKLSERTVAGMRRQLNPPD